MVFPLSLSVCCVALFFSTAVLAQPLARADAVRQAIAHSPEVEAAHRAHMAARARSLQAWALPDPELHLEYEGMSRVLGFDTFSERAIGISQRLEFPAKWWLRGKASIRQAQAVQLTVYETTRQDVALRVHLTYDRVLADAQIARFAEETVGLSEDFLNRAKTRFAAGDVPKLDVMRAEVSLGRQQNRLTTAQNALSVSRAALNTLLNRTVDAPLALTDSLQYESIPMNHDALRARALIHRPELQGAERALQSAQTGQSLARFSILPDVSVGLFRQTVDSPAGKQGFWRVGIAAEVPVWGMFRQRGMIAETGAKKAQAEAERDQVQARVVQEVTVAYMNLQAVARQMETMRERIWPTAEAAYEMARRSYDAGKATYLDVLEAHRERMDVRTEYAELLFEHRAALARLGRAVGGDPMSDARTDGGFEQ